MEQEVFFDFCSKLSSSTVLAPPIELQIDDLKLIRGDYRGINFPVIFKQKEGKKFCDILDTGYPSLYLISERMKILLMENNLTGWKTFPIKLYDKKGNVIAGYNGFSITGSSGPKNYEKSQIIEKQFVPLGPIIKFYKGFLIDKWDKSDFFLPEKTTMTCITKKAAEILRKNKITNMYLEETADYESDFRIVKKITCN